MDSDTASTYADKAQTSEQEGASYSSPNFDRKCVTGLGSLERFWQHQYKRMQGLQDIKIIDEGDLTISSRVGESKELAGDSQGVKMQPPAGLSQGLKSKELVGESQGVKRKPPAGESRELTELSEDIALFHSARNEELTELSEDIAARNEELTELSEDIALFHSLLTKSSQAELQLCATLGVILKSRWLVQKKV
jgi:hypothetical protein